MVAQLKGCWHIIALKVLTSPAMSANTSVEIWIRHVLEAMGAFTIGRLRQCALFQAKKS
jgi:hypothetical protein